MMFKFEKLEIWKLALEHIDNVDAIGDQLPRSEDSNLKSQITRAATSVALNIAEGSTGQTDAEQARFLGFALRSLIEIVACIEIIRRRKLPVSAASLDHARSEAQLLLAKITSTSIPRPPSSVIFRPPSFFIDCSTAL